MDSIEEQIKNLIPAKAFDEPKHVRSIIVADEDSLREQADNIITYAIEHRVITSYSDQAFHNKAWLRSIVNKLKSDGYLHTVVHDFWLQQISRLPY